MTVAHDWLSTGSSLVSLKKITYPAQSIQSNPVMKEPSVFFFSFSPHVHTALLFNAEVREGGAAGKPSEEEGEGGRQENVEEVKKNKNIQKEVRGKEAWEVRTATTLTMCQGPLSPKTFEKKI